jgi:hypothetical protein
MPESFGQGAMKNVSLQIAVVVTATALGVPTALLIGGILTPRSFGIAGLAAMVCVVPVWYCGFKYFSPLDAGIFQRQSTTSRGKGFYLRVAAFLIVLAFAAWATRGGLWLPRLIGASMLLLFVQGRYVLNGESFAHGDFCTHKKHRNLIL